jgi:hypothetical protein
MSMPSQLFDRVLSDEGRKQNMIQAPVSLIYNFLGNVIPLALVSFSGSHVCRFDMNLWVNTRTKSPLALGFYSDPDNWPV